MQLSSTGQGTIPLIQRKHIENQANDNIFQKNASIVQQPELQYHFNQKEGSIPKNHKDSGMEPQIILL